MDADAPRDDARARRPATYVLPIRRRDRTVSTELTAYLTDIAARCELIVVDGSDADAFAAAHAAWAHLGMHVAPDPALACLNGKVHGVLTGLAYASHEAVVIADDDVRYDRGALEAAIDLLDRADLVRPQNYFSPLVWHARWDTARSLLNRALGGRDFPGTLGVRRSAMRATGGYDGNVLFENLELIRTVRAAGGVVVSPADLYVRRIPPAGRHFWSQRPRQAYDELARPWRLVAQLAIAPLIAAALTRRRGRHLVIAASLVMLLAADGRRRAGGSDVFPVSAVLIAPLWLLERSVGVWIALGARLRGGCPYAGHRLRVAANSRRTIRRRLARSPSTNVRDEAPRFAMRRAG